MSRARVHGALMTVALLFSANYIISKVAMTTMQPLVFAYLRVVGSAILLHFLARGRSDDAGVLNVPKIIALSLLGVVINQTLFLAGLARTNAHVAAVLITTIPLFAVAAAIVLGTERATAMKLGGIALAAFGALLVVGGEGLAGHSGSVTGAIMLVTNCLAYALYLVLSKPIMMRVSPLVVLARIFAAGTILMLPIAAVPLLRERWSAIPTRTWVALAIVIALPTVFAYILSGWALRHADSSLVAVYTYVQPVLTTVLAAIFLKEEIRPIVLLAAVLIFGGVWIAGRPAPPAPVAE